MIILAILRACRVACHSFTFSGYVVVSRADFRYHEVLRRIDIEERGCKASLSLRWWMDFFGNDVRPIYMQGANASCLQMI